MAETTKTITGTITFTITTEAPTPVPAETTTVTETTTTGTLPAPAEVAPAEVTPVETITELQKMQDAYNAAVDFCVELDAEEFCELIRWAKAHHNKFPTYVVELKGMINADDIYKDAIRKICTPLGEKVCAIAFDLVDAKKILELSEYLKYIKTIVEEWGDI